MLVHDAWYAIANELYNRIGVNERKNRTFPPVMSKTYNHCPSPPPLSRPLFLCSKLRRWRLFMTPGGQGGRSFVVVAAAAAAAVVVVSRALYKNGNFQEIPVKTGNFQDFSVVWVLGL